jgi:hypothetical protein
MTFWPLLVVSANLPSENHLAATGARPSRDNQHGNAQWRGRSDFLTAQHKRPARLAYRHPGIELIEPPIGTNVRG